VDLAIYAWPITGLLLTLLLVGIARYRARRSAVRRVPWTVIALGLAFPLAILVYGSAMHATGPNWTPRAGAGLAPTVIYGCLVGHVVLVSIAVWRAPGARGMVAAVGACQVWWTLGAAFVALMSVSGDWL
jgi:hypothetical protein